MLHVQALNMKGFDIVVTTHNTTIEHSDVDAVTTRNTAIEHSDEDAVTTIKDIDKDTVSTAIENNDGEPVTDTTENSSRILDTIKPSLTTSYAENLSIGKQSITNLETASFTTDTTQQPEQPVFTKEDIHRSSILKETPENSRSESSTETVTFDPLTNPTETRTKNPEINNNSRNMGSW